MFGKRVPNRKVTVRNGRPADRTPVSFVFRDLMDEEFLGIASREVTAVDSTLPHTRVVDV